MQKYKEAKKLEKDNEQIREFMRQLILDDKRYTDFIKLDPALWALRKSRDGSSDTYFGTQSISKGREFQKRTGKFRAAEWKREGDIENSLGYACRPNVYEKLDSLKALSNHLKLDLKWDFDDVKNVFVGMYSPYWPFREEFTAPSSDDVMKIVKAVFCEERRVDITEESGKRGTTYTVSLPSL